MQLDAGERVGLIGRNGTGKSSLMHVLAGRDKLDDGILTRQGRSGFSLSRTGTEPSPKPPLCEKVFSHAAVLKTLPDEREKWAAIARLDEYLHRLRTASEQNPQAASGGEKKKSGACLGTQPQARFAAS